LRTLPGVLALIVAAALLAAILLTSRAGAHFLLSSVEWAGGSTPVDQLASAQAIALLGGRTARVHFAARLQRRTGLPLLISGKGTGDAPFAAESEKMAQILRDEYRIAPRWVEKESLDTAGNALFSWCLVGPQGIRRVALVTDPRHMLRARSAFRAVGFEVLPAPTENPDARPALAWRDLLPTRRLQPQSVQALVEWAGAAAMLWEGWFGRLSGAQNCASSSARIATKLHIAVRNSIQGPGRASRWGNSSSAVRRRERSHWRPSRQS
jgi:uncharacterized SAM-binding protein YcdF (DUF218 family)